MSIRNARRFTLAVIALLNMSLTGCFVGIEQTVDDGPIGPQRVEGATEIMKFDPTTIPLGDRAPVRGSCRTSERIPGTYRCELADSAAEPCFALSGVRLLCGPNPVARTYQTLVEPDGPLPPAPAPTIDQLVEFFVELDGGRVCGIHTGIEPVVIGGVTATFECDAPYTFLLGFEKSAPAWEAALYSLDPTTGEGSGKTPINVLRAWVP